MPYTLAHPAAVLPLHSALRPRLRLAALVIGSTTPDYQYFLHLYTVGGFSHTLPGLLLVCLPAGWLTLWLFDRFGRRGLATLLPPGWQLPARPARAYSPVATSAALLLGAATHVVWDAFTHASGWGVDLFPWLAGTIHLGSVGIPWFNVLQHGSTLLGLAAVAAAMWLWARRQPPAPVRALVKRMFGAAVVLAIAGVLNGLRFRSAGIQQFLVAGGVSVTLTLGGGLILLGLLRGGSAADVG